MTRERRGLVICYTGDGKGKTTAALGLAVRAVGAGLRVRMLQFIKGEWKPAELKGLALLGDHFSMEQLGLGFVTYKPKLPWERHAEAAQAAWAQAGREMQSGAQDVLILDEINNAFRFGLLDPRRRARGRTDASDRADGGAYRPRGAAVGPRGRRPCDRDEIDQAPVRTGRRRPVRDRLLRDERG